MRSTTWPKVLVVLSVAWLMVGSAPALADPGAAPERPYKAEWTGTYEVFVEPDWCDIASGFLPLHIVGHGHGTHLGAFDVEVWGCNNFGTGEMVDTEALVVAANGDELYATAFSPPGEGPIFVIYSGGTGRFVNASGEAVENVWSVPTSATTGVVGGRLIGTIAYDASDRSG